MIKRAKITIVGGGNVGASCAVWAASKELGDIVVVDLPELEDRVKGKMLDLAQCGPIERFDAQIIGTSDYARIAGSDVVVITAGIPRKPGMSRDDLIATNVKIVKSVSEKIAQHAPATPPQSQSGVRRRSSKPFITQSNRLHVYYRHRWHLFEYMCSLSIMRKINDF